LFHLHEYTRYLRHDIDHFSLPRSSNLHL
jgi:hypothetical protein